MLDQRQSRNADRRGEAEKRMSLIRDLCKDPEALFQELVRAICELTCADSGGVSLLDREQKKFVWPAVSGGLASYVGAGTPMDFGPCGTVLDRDEPVLFLHPERHFTYLVPIAPALEEVLLVPFHMNKEPVGTIWAVIHEKDKHFEPEDRRLLENLSEFAATAYHVLTESGLLKTMLSKLPAPKPVRSLTQTDGNWSFKGEK
ncbi:MAG: GAF domain-containing protein [Luteolibacter sp.]